MKPLSALALIARAVFLFANVFSLTGPAHALPLRPASDKLADWTPTLAKTQPDDAFVAIYKVGGYHLVFVGAEHANDVQSRTFKLIAEAYRAYHFDTVIAEGWPTSFGPNNARIVLLANEAVTAKRFQKGGETVPTVRGGLAQGAAIWGGEADDGAIKRAVEQSGVSSADLLGFYVLRFIPQAIRERDIADAGDPRLAAVVEAQLSRNRQRLALGPAVLPTYAAWADWYGALQRKPISKAFDLEETGPLIGGRYASNRIAATVAKARDVHLHNLIVAHLGVGESVLVVYGGSHLMIQRPALDAALGSPCYSGSSLRHASIQCR